MVFPCNSDIYLISAWGSDAHRENSNMNKKVNDENHCSWQITTFWVKYDTLKATGNTHTMKPHSRLECLTKDAAGVAYFIWPFSHGLMGPIKRLHRPYTLSNSVRTQSRCKNGNSWPDLSLVRTWEYLRVLTVEETNKQWQWLRYVGGRVLF